MSEPLDADFEIEPIVDGVIFRPFGAIDMRRATWLRNRLLALLEPHPSRLIVDLAEVDHIDSPVIAALVTVLQAARRRSTQLILCNLEGRVRALFEITRLHEGAFTIAGTLDEAVALDNRRKFHRYRPGDLACDLGEILDVSATGLRVRCRRRLRRRRSLTLRDGEREVTLDVEAVWSRRLGFRRHEVGLRFVNLNAEAAKRLADMIGAVSERRLRAA